MWETVGHLIYLSTVPPSRGRAPEGEGDGLLRGDRQELVRAGQAAPGQPGEAQSRLHVLAALPALPPGQAGYPVHHGVHRVLQVCTGLPKN